MKRILIAIIAMLCFGFSNVYCKEKIIKKDGMYLRGENTTKSKLKKNQIMSVTKIVEDPVYLQVDNWSKVRITSDFLDELKGHKDFTNQEKCTLLTYIFDDLPLNSEDSVVREVFIGDYFENKLPLEIRVGVMTPKGDALLKNQKVIIILSNVLKDADENIKKKMGIFAGFDSNACTVSGLNNNKLTNIQHIKKGESLSEEALDKLEPITQVMTIQGYLADEDSDNDLTSIGILNKLIDRSDVEPAIHILAMLKKYDYLLSKDSIPEAEIIWAEIKAFSKNVPGDMNPESLEETNGESLFLMKELQNRQASNN